jgi:hypothetical protein
MAVSHSITESIFRRPSVFDFTARRSTVSILLIDSISSANCFRFEAAVQPMSAASMAVDR